MKSFIKTCFLVATIGVLTQCSQPEKTRLVKFMGEAQGTYYMVTYYDPKGRDFREEIDKLLKNFDMSVSLWEPNSIISKINRNEEMVVPDEVFLTLFKMAKEINEKSGGAFDPTVGPMVTAWGFGFREKMEISPKVIDSLVHMVGFSKVELQHGTISKKDDRIQFDFNAIAQGYSVDLIGEYLAQQGITRYLVDVGGEVLGKGVKPDGENWKVGIEKPAENAHYGEELNAIVRLVDRALATSGNYRKFYEKEGVKYSHTIDPFSGYPVQHPVLSVSVLAETCALADGWATAFMVLGLEESLKILENEPGLEAYFIYAEKGEEDLKTYATEGFRMIMLE